MTAPAANPGGVAFIDLETMVRSHGALNATAVLLAVVTVLRPNADLPGRLPAD